MTFTLTRFQQGQFLDASDPETRGGVCVALCDLWLQSLFQAPGAAPRLRLQALAVDFSLRKPISGATDGCAMPSAARMRGGTWARASASITRNRPSST